MNQALAIPAVQNNILETVTDLLREEFEQFLSDSSLGDRALLQTILAKHSAMAQNFPQPDDFLAQAIRLVIQEDDSL